MKVDLKIIKTDNESGKAEEIKIKDNKYREVLNKEIGSLLVDEEINVEIYYDQQRIDSFFIAKK